MECFFGPIGIAISTNLGSIIVGFYRCVPIVNKIRINMKFEVIGDEF